MRDNFWKITACISVVLMVISIGGVKKMKDKVKSLESTISRRTSVIEEEIGNIYSNIDKYMKKDTEIFADLSYDYGKIDREKGTAQIVVKATPKKYVEGETVLTVFLNGKEYPLDMTNGDGLLEVSVPAFDKVEISKLTIKNGNEIENHNLDATLYPDGRVIPEINIDFYPDYTLSNEKDGNKKLSIDADTTFNIYCTDTNLGIESIKLIEKIDGKDTGNDINVPISSDKNGDKVYSYLEEEADNLQIAPEVKIQRSHILKEGQTLSYAAVIKDNCGLTYYSDITLYTVGEEYNLDDDLVYDFDVGFSVTNSEGKLVRSADARAKY